MSVYRSDDILAIAKESVAAFIRDQASSRTLSPLIRSLNDELLRGDEIAREKAAKALSHLGFVEAA
jgi:hypothetical protein